MAIQFFNNINLTKTQNTNSLFSSKTKEKNNLHLLNSPIKDSLSFSGNQENWNDSVSPEAQVQLKKVVDELISGNLEGKKFIGKGSDGTVYKALNIEGFPDGIAVKLSHTSDKDSQTGRMQRPGQEFANERNFLQKVSHHPNIQQMVGYISSNGRNALLSAIVKGQEPNHKTCPFDSTNLGSLLDTLAALDKDGILHRDLKKENILIDKDTNTVNLIDFGEAVKVDLNQPDFNQKEHNIPPFTTPSNVRNFEDTCLAPYLNELGKEDPQKAKTLFTDYLSLRAEKIHVPAEKTLSAYLKANDKKLSIEQKTALEKARRFEQVQAAVLKEPKPEIIDLELLKMQTTYFSELAYKNELVLLNPLANMTLKMWALINAKKFEIKANQLQAKPNSVETKEYLNTTKNIAKFRQTKLTEWTKGLFGWLMNCSEKDANEANPAEKALQEQFMKKNLNVFEIPNIEEKLT